MNERAKGFGHKADRNREIVERWKAGDVTYQMLADEYGLTRQRVHQIVTALKDREVA